MAAHPGFRDGPTVGLTVRWKSSKRPRRAASSWLGSSIPNRPCHALPWGYCARKSPLLAFPARRMGGTWRARIFRLRRDGGILDRAERSCRAQGRVVERALTPNECDELGVALPVLGESTFDIYLNARAFWRNVPAAVWNYKLGGYQVLKKWLSYRERHVLDRPLRLEEIQHFTDTVRRIAAILLTAKLYPEANSANARNSRKQ